MWPGLVVARQLLEAVAQARVVVTAWQLAEGAEQLAGGLGMAFVLTGR